MPQSCVNITWTPRLHQAFAVFPTFCNIPYAMRFTMVGCSFVNVHLYCPTSSSRNLKKFKSPVEIEMLTWFNRVLMPPGYSTRATGVQSPSQPTQRLDQSRVWKSEPWGALNAWHSTCTGRPGYTYNWLSEENTRLFSIMRFNVQLWMGNSLHPLFHKACNYLSMANVTECPVHPYNC